MDAYLLHLKKSIKTGNRGQAKLLLAKMSSRPPLDKVGVTAMCEFPAHTRQVESWIKHGRST